MTQTLPNHHNIFALPNTGSMISFDDSRASTQHAGNLAPLIRLSYGRMVVMALPYTITMSIAGLAALWYLS